MFPTLIVNNIKNVGKFTRLQFDFNRCVRPWEVCDGFRECKDRSDELEEFCNQWGRYQNLSLK